MNVIPLRPSGRAAALALSAALLLTVASCGRHRPPVNPAYRSQIEAWRSQRLKSLTSKTGWLTLVGLYWLEPGENTFGSDPGDTVIIPGPDVPAVAGTLDMTADGAVTVHVRRGVPVTMAGEAVAEASLRSDAKGEPDMLHLGDALFYVIDRGGRLAVRVKDPASKTRRDFKGITSFPIDPAFRVKATFEPYQSPRSVTVPTEAGTQATMLAPGVVRFSLEGRELTLQPWVSTPQDREFFFVFRDATTGKQTYGAGRFLDVEAPAPGSHTVILDFNKAYNPPCAFTPYATCPLPPKDNDLPVAVTAGEKFQGHH